MIEVKDLCAICPDPNCGECYKPLRQITVSPEVWQKLTEAEQESLQKMFGEMIKIESEEKGMRDINIQVNVWKRLHRVKKVKLIDLLTVYAYLVEVNEKRYILFAKSMPDACEKAFPLTRVTDIYENEKKYIKSFDVKPGKIMRRPFWYYGRIYQ